MRHLLGTTFLAGLILLSGCGSDRDSDSATDTTEVVVYSGRSQALVGGYIEQYGDVTGVNIRARHGRDAELLQLLAEEGNRSSAGIFWANTVGALSAADVAGYLVELPEDVVSIPAAFAPENRHWVPLTTRFRILAYHPDRVNVDTLPESVMDLPGRTDFAGRIGWTPTYSSFQDFITQMRLTHGEEVTREWLEGMIALNPRVYPNNTPMLEAMDAGELDVILTNHYYVFRVWARDEPQNVGIHHFASGDVGNLALVTGAGVLTTASDQDAAIDFISYLLSTEAQSASAERGFEYPVVRGSATPIGGLTFDEALELSPAVDYEALSDLEGTLALLRDVGLL